MAYQFASASSQYLSATNPVSAAPFTVAAWARVDNITGNKAIVTLNQNSGTNRFALYAASARLSWFVNSSAGNAQAQVTADTTANTWFHGCAVETSAASRTVYINGGLSGSNTTSRTPASIDAINVGTDRNNNTNTSLLSGQVCEVGIWSAALTLDEIASLAKGITCDKVRPSALVFYAPLVRELIDVRGGLTITNNNTATVAVHPRVYT
jgi:hypothetical protein